MWNISERSTLVSRDANFLTAQSPPVRLLCNTSTTNLRQKLLPWNLSFIAETSELREKPAGSPPPALEEETVETRRRGRREKLAGGISRDLWRLSSGRRIGT